MPLPYLSGVQMHKALPVLYFPYKGQGSMLLVTLKQLCAFPTARPRITLISPSASLKSNLFHLVYPQ